MLEATEEKTQMLTPAQATRNWMPLAWSTSWVQRIAPPSNKFKAAKIRKPPIGVLSQNRSVKSQMVRMAENDRPPYFKPLMMTPFMVYLLLVSNESRTARAHASDHMRRRGYWGAYSRYTYMPVSLSEPHNPTRANPIS